MKNIFTLFLLLLSLSYGHAQIPAKKFQKKLNFWRWVYHNSGAQIALIEDGKVVQVFNTGATTYKGESKIDSKTMFQVGKANQIFTALTMMKLASEGEIAWNKPINDQLSHPVIHLRESSIIKDSKPTPLQLLNHSSGLNRPYFGFHNNKYAISTEELIMGSSKTGKKRIQNFQKPLKEYLYSEGAFAVAGALFEQFSEENFPDYIQEQFLSQNPLDFYFNGEKISSNKRTQAYLYSKKEQETPLSYPNIYGRGLWTNAKSYGNFLSTILNKESYQKFGIKKKYYRYFTKAFIDIPKSPFTQCVVFERKEENPNIFKLNDRKDGFRTYFEYNIEKKKGYLILINSEYDYWFSKKEDVFKERILKILHKMDFRIN
ncbi:MAG: serine hydrolase [Flavobacteriales bacterium]|jgi:CubicO group peptidase (beta-lactamase class C family)|nr:serine hydrolase [Flavobacteriales bacterium]